MILPFQRQKSSSLQIEVELMGIINMSNHDEILIIEVSMKADFHGQEVASVVENVSFKMKLLK